MVFQILLLIRNLNNHDGILSKDVGPGNCLINAWIQNHTNEKFDLDGKISNRGKINEIILEQALETHENNFQKKNNISLDTNDFDISFVRGLNLEDGAATLTAFTAKIISSKNKLPFKTSMIKKIIKLLYAVVAERIKVLLNKLNLILNKKILFFTILKISIKWRFYRVSSIWLFSYKIRNVITYIVSFNNWMFSSM